VKRPLRLFLIVAASLVALVALLVGLAFTSPVQTWAVRRAVADVPGAKIEVGRASLGLRSVRLENVRVEQPGLVLTLPRFEIELPLLDAAKGKVAVARLVAKGWTLDLTTAASAPAKAAPVAFDGVFKFLKLPVGLSLERAEIEGDVLQPGGKTHVALTGGGLGAGKEGTFKLATMHTASAADAVVRTASANAELTVGMDAPDAISSFALTADTAASGPKISGESKARLTARARRGPGGEESYALSVRAGERELLGAEAGLPAAGALTGKWTADATDAELAPFRQFLAGPLPGFATKGQGTFAASRDFADVSASGKIAGSADKLETLRTELAAMGRVEFAADFDAARRGDTLRVSRLKVDLGGAQPVVTVEALQAFEFDTVKRTLAATSPTADLARASLRDAPLAWAQPWLPKELLLTGSLDGSVTAGARDGGFAVRVTRAAALIVRGGRLSQAGQVWWQGGLVIPEGGAAVSPQGWQAEAAALGLAADEAGAGTVVLGRLKVAQSAGAGQPLRIELADSSVGLAALRALAPALALQLPVTAGTVKLALTASLAAKKELSLKLALSNLAAGAAAPSLPDATLDLRADIGSEGTITFNAPLTVTAGTRRTALTLGGTFMPAKSGNGGRFDAQAAGEAVYVQDLTAFSSLAPASGSAPKAGPPWAGYTGVLKFSLKQLVVAPGQSGALAGTLTLDASGPKLEAQGALDGATPAPVRIKGGVAHSPGATVPYAMTADVELDDYQLGALRSTLEARVNLGIQLTSRATAIDGLVNAAQGKLRLTSRGGVTHLLAKSAPLQALGTGAAVVGVGASLIGALTGNSTMDKVGAVSSGVARIADLLQSIRFDQLNVLLSRDASNDLVLEDFTLVAPEVRLTGKGRLKSVAGRELGDLPLALGFQLAARGTVGDGLRGLGLVAAAPDSLGYFPLAFEPQIGGTVGSPDKSAFYNQLAQVALARLMGGAPAATPPRQSGGAAGGVLDAVGGLLNQIKR
jgi:hypothetical protein